MAEQNPSKETESGRAVLYLGDDPVDQAGELVFCPLGMRIMTTRPIEPYTLIDATLKVTSEDGTPQTLCCRGVVADCEFLEGKKCFRVIVVFTDTDPAKRRLLEHLSHTHHTLCSYCANY